MLVSFVLLLSFTVVQPTNVIEKKKFAESFELYSYMVKYDRQPIRFIFKFYKPNDEWVLYSYALDDNLDTEIQEAAKLYYLELDKK